jgi:hypothetical protein
LASKPQSQLEAPAAGPDDQTGCRPLAGGDATAFGPGLFGDTSPSSARRYFAGLAALGPARRLQIVSGLSRAVRSQALLGLRMRHPEFHEAELRRGVAEVMYGRLDERFQLDRHAEKAMPNNDDFDPYLIALAVGEALDELKIAYFVGGSLASGLQGEPRSTNDIDMVLDLRESEIAPLAARLGPDFSVDEEGLREAIRRRRSDNIYFLPFFTKIDLFVCGTAPFDRSEMSRRHRIEVRSGRFLWFKSTEDTVLRKLLWFRQGGETSEKQWRDITSVLRISGDSLDRAYLDKWSNELGIEDLLARAQAEAATA